MSRRPAVIVSLLGVLAVTLYAALAAVQILVLNPLHAAPGRTLSQIYGDMSAASEDPGAVRVVVILAVGVLIALVVAALAIRSRASAPLTTLLFLGVLIGGAPAYFIASFGAGMALADTYLISGADYSPWAIPLYVVSAAAAVGVIAPAIMMTRRPRPAAAVA